MKLYRLYRITYEKSNRGYYLFFYSSDYDKAYGKALDLARKYNFYERALHELNGVDIRRIV